MIRPGTFFQAAPSWPWWIVGAMLLLVLAVTALPFTLPLGGPETLNPAALADPGGAFIPIESKSTYYLHVPGDGPPVVLIHGFGGSTVTWIDTLPALAAAGYDVYALDLPGFGLSQKGLEGDYSHAAQAAHVAQFMDALGIPPAVIVGHSMGGNVAAHLALSYPQYVDRLVLVDAAILGDYQLPAAVNTALGSSHRLAVPDLVFELPFARRWAQVILRQAIGSLSEELLFDAIGRDAQIRPEVVAGYKRAFSTPEWELGLLGMVRDSDRNGLPVPVSNIQVPTLILWGDSDTWVSPDDGVRLEELLPDARRVEFPGVGHLPMHEVPEAFNDALLAFLDGG